MKKALALIALFASISSFSIAGDQADSFEIKDWTFSWVLLKSDDVTLSIEKAPDKTYVRLREDYESISLTADESKAIGDALAKTNEHYGRLKGASGEGEEAVEAGKFKIRFNIHPTHGFRVWIRDGRLPFGGALSITREQSETLAPLMNSADARIRYLNSRIQL